jgi:hypothetical protein
MDKMAHAFAMSVSCASWMETHETALTNPLELDGTT